MSLTFAGPLATTRAGHLNYSLDDAPKHRILFEPYPRRMRALVGSHTVLDSTGGALLHESNILPVYYAPLSDFDADALTPTDHQTHCPFKGDAAYFTLTVGDRELENAVWHYPEPIAAAPWLEGYAALYWDTADLWLCEDEPVHGHVRDPYHRVDVMESSRRVTVKVGGHTVAESDRPMMLFETSLPPRPYLIRADVLPGVLEPSETTSYCSYKGEATYWHVRTPDGLVEDAAWSYEAPLPESAKAASHLAFDGDGVEVEVS